MSKRELDQPMGHAEDNDGIEEYDNPLPDWWVGLFFFTIIWAVGYTVEYHFISDRSQVAAYEAELAAAAERWPPSEVDAAVELTPEAFEAGRALYQQNCASCHAADLTGGIGPSLVDGEWVHGGALEDVRRSIDEGIPEQGMMAWGPVMGTEGVNQVTAYVWKQAESANGTDSAGEAEGGVP